MKVIYNKEMEKLLSNKIRNNNLDIDCYFSLPDHLLVLDKDLDIYSDYYFFSNRVDRFLIGNTLSRIEYLNISFFIWWNWISWIKKIYNSKVFYLIIQYDDWSWIDDNSTNLNEGFFIKLFTEEWYNEYFWGKWIEKKKNPYISIKY